MIRIQTANNQAGITIAIDGQLVGLDVEEVEASIQKASEQRKNVHLFLRDVSHIDETAHSLLSRLAAHGVELSAAGLYSSYVINQIQFALSCREGGESDSESPLGMFFGTVFRRLLRHVPTPIL
jgi:ABC-type transporter Mla MlaB component